ncbi:M23 family metallopeptidase [Helicobacter felis]|uniref:Peptidase M23B Metalloendopeptidase n=2 Tax=Helicobacter felis TaxID=214 RepID=E7A9J4_HELFC|nr:putative peptidase M23B Metalloendopeptidase [Helicobacter felis ATCC 49179]
MWRWIVLIMLVGCGYLSYNYLITKDGQGKIELVMQVAPDKQNGIAEAEVTHPTHWNLKHRMRVTLETKAKIRSYHVRVSTSDHLVVYEKEQIVLDEPSRLSFELPKPSIQLSDQTLLHYEIRMRDWSNAHFFSGNLSTANFDLTLDTTPPTLQIISQSSSITYGGSALVVFSVEEESLDAAWLSDGKQKFKTFPFVKAKHYAAILPWSLQQRAFSATIIARDKAYNTKIIPLNFTKITRMPYYRRDIELNKKYANKEAALQGLKTHPDFERTKMRLNLEEIVQADLDNTIADIARLNPFNPLAMSKPRVLLPFGAQKRYLFQGSLLGQALHAGVDFMTKHSKIQESNEGRVVLAEEIQSYGKGILVAYGLGLHAFYGGLSKILVKKSDLVESGRVLGISGFSYANKLDHVHFEMLVQGIPVYPHEWMDAGFIQRFNAVLQEARQRIQEKR